jgi:transmembrane sensor
MHIPWDLIKKYCKGELTGSEEDNLSQWCNAEEINQLFFEEVLADDSFRVALATSNDRANEEQWATVYNSLKPAKPNIIFSRNQFFRIASIAATLLILVGVGITLVYISWQNRGFSENDFTYIYSPRGQRTQVVLPDSTRVWLNSETSIKYPVSFNKKLREVTIVGEAFFKVKKNPEKPFFVNTTDIKVKVYGTSFNIKAYPTDKYIETTLIEGKLSVIAKTGSEKPGNEIFLKPKDRLKFQIPGAIETDSINPVSEKVALKNNSSKKANLPKVLLSRNVNPDQENLWKEGKLIFKDETFGEMTIKLERWYDVKIHFEDEKIKNFRFTGQFDKETINQAMEALKISSRHCYQYKIIFRDIYIKAKH